MQSLFEYSNYTTINEDNKFEIIRYVAAIINEQKFLPDKDARTSALQTIRSAEPVESSNGPDLMSSSYECAGNGGVLRFASIQLSRISAVTSGPG